MDYVIRIKTDTDAGVKIISTRLEPDIIPELCATIRDLLGDLMSRWPDKRKPGKRDLWPVSGDDTDALRCATCGGTYYRKADKLTDNLCPAEDCPRHMARAMLRKAESL